MQSKPPNRSKVAATFVVMLLTTAVMASLLPIVTADPSPVEIVSIDPMSGPVGETVRVVGEIDTINGSYRIFFDETEVKNGTATAATVDTMFTVPLSKEGNHNITLVDNVSGNQSSPSTFNVLTSYYVTVDPDRIQEGLHTTITVGVNDAKANSTLTFTINVTDPRPVSHTATLTVSTNATGSGSNSSSYHEDFSVDATTSYVGIYPVAVVGASETLAEGNFSVGITDRLVYARTETGTRVHVRGAGYEPDKNVSVNILLAGVSVEGYPDLTVSDAEGVVVHFWRIPNDAQLGLYTITLTNGTGVHIKEVHDTQSFTVTEAVIVSVQTQNKYDKQPLANVFVLAFLDGMYVAEGTTDETGWIDLQVSHGNYTFRAFLRTVEVGRLDYIVLGDAILPPLECELAQLTVAVEDAAGYPLPFINITIASNETGVLHLETNNSGIISTNLFTDDDYIIEARRYGSVFSTVQIANLTVNRRIDLTVPTVSVSVKVVDSKGIPLRDVDVAVFDWSSGVGKPVQSETTDNSGTAIIDVTFGKYRVRVYNREHTVILNSTVVNLVEDQSLVIHSKISNVDLLVRVKDYFGHPIPNALVEVKRENGDTYSQKTSSSGTASFNSIYGGDSQISISVAGAVSETATLYLVETKEVAFKLEKFVAVGESLIEVTQLIALVSLGIVIIVSVLALMRRKLGLNKILRRTEKE